MTLYGESDEAFRPRPARSTLLLFSTSVLLLTMQIAVLAGSISWFLSVSRWQPGQPLPIYAPFAQRFQLAGVEDPLAARQALAPLAMLVVGTLVLYFWPTRQRLASRIATQLTTITFAIVAMTLAMDDSIMQWLTGDLREFWKPLTIIGGLFLIYQSESQAITLLNNLFALETPARRLALWAARIPLALALVALLALLQEAHTVALATGAALAVTLIAQLGRRPAATYEKLDEVHMREASAVTSIAAAAVVTASIAFFGSDLTGSDRRALVLSAPGVKVVPAASFRQKEPRDTGAADEAADRESGEKKDESVIDIRWSDKKN